MKISRDQLAIFLFGTVKFQIGWLILTCALLNGLFSNNPNWDMGSRSPHSNEMLFLLGFIFLAGGIVTGLQQVKFLQTGKVVSGRAMSIREDRSGDDPTYHSTFEYSDDEGLREIVRLQRDHDDIAIGQTVHMVIGENGNKALVEQDLAGGLTLANVLGAEPVPLICLYRVIAVPLLTLVPLVVLQPAIGSFVTRIINSGHYEVGLIPIVLQCVWIFKNKRHFVVSKIELCACGGKKCDRAQ